MTKNRAAITSSFKLRSNEDVLKTQLWKTLAEMTVFQKFMLYNEGIDKNFLLRRPKFGEED